MTNPAFTEPLEYDFGTDYNYARWNPNTRITLTNVPWNNDYKDVVRFETRGKLNDYIDSLPGNFDAPGTYAKANAPIDLDIPFNVAQRYNYVRAVNPAQPTDSGDFQREFYYFVLDVQYMSPRSTRLVLQLDVWNTFVHEVQFGRAYIERGHVGIANEDHFRNNGRDFLAIPEGLDIGSEYMNVANRTNIIMSNSPAGGNSTPNRESGYSVLVCSTVNLDRPAGDRRYPQLWTAIGSSFQGLPSGAGFYIFPNANAFKAYLANMSDKPWVTQGIISVTAIPNIHRYYPNMSRNTTANGAYAEVPTGTPAPIKHDMWNDWRYASEIMDNIPPKYRHLRKFWTYPYMIIEITTNTGNVLVLKPEAWNSPHASIKEQAALVPPNQRIVYTPMSYNSTQEASNTTLSMSNDPGEGIDLAAMISNFPTFAVVNNNAVAYLAQNANSIQNAFTSADWAQSKALRGNQVGYDQAYAGMGAAWQSNNIQTNADRLSTGRANQLSQDMNVLNNTSSMMQGIGMGGVGGALAGPAGVLGGAAIGAAVSGFGALTNTMGNNLAVSAANDQQALRGATANALTDVALQNGSYMADTNKALADWAAKGDYENNIASLNAKLQDARMIQPSVSGGFGGDAFNLIFNMAGITVKWKMIDQASMSVIGDYWLRYGYAVNRSMNLPPDLAVMDRFTYWKAVEVYIRASRVPEAHKQMLRGIIEKGVTVWKSPNDIGIVDPAVNKKIPGIRIDGYEPPPTPEIPEPEPEIQRRKRRKMLVFLTNDPNPKWALAGSSPGTTANWLETESAPVAQGYLDATGQSSPVTLSPVDFATTKLRYMESLDVSIVDNGE